MTEYSGAAGDMWLEPVQLPAAPSRWPPRSSRRPGSSGGTGRSPGGSPAPRRAHPGWRGSARAGRTRAASFSMRLWTSCWIFCSRRSSSSSWLEEPPDAAQALVDGAILEDLLALVENAGGCGWRRGRPGARLLEADRGDKDFGRDVAAEAAVSSRSRTTVRIAPWIPCSPGRSP